MESTKKNLIYITEEELEKLPNGTSVYVLSSSTGQHKSHQPLLPTPPNTSFSSNSSSLSPWGTPPSLGCQIQPMFLPPLPTAPSLVSPPSFPFTYYPPACYQYPPPIPGQIPLFPPLAPPSSTLQTPVIALNNAASNFTDPTQQEAKPQRSRPPEIKDSTWDGRGEVVFQHIRCTPAVDYFETVKECKVATQRMINIENNFEKSVLKRREEALAGYPPIEVVRPPLKRPEILDNPRDEERPFLLSKNGRRRQNARKAGNSNSSGKSDDGTPEQSSTSPSQHANTFSSQLSDSKLKQQQIEVEYKCSHPYRLHRSIWHNEPGEYNSGPACSCKPKYRIGPLHNQFEGEAEIPPCLPESNNRNRLYHYRVRVNPTTNFFNLKSTVIPFNGNNYYFDGYSIFLHCPIDDVPPCQLLRFNSLYEFTHVKEDFPENFTVRALDMMTEYVFKELLELLDVNWKSNGITSGCPVVHLMPRFVRPVDEESAELLSANVILDHWMHQAQLPLVQASDLPAIRCMANSEWSARIDDLRGTLAWKPGAKPPAIRIDQLDRLSSTTSSSTGYPVLVHMTFTPMKLSLSRDPKYKSVLKNYLKLLYLMDNKPRITPEDRKQLADLTNKLDSMDHSGVHRRETTVELSSEGFYRTGIRPDLAHFALNMASFITHIRCIMSLSSLESCLGYRFRDKSLLYQALTHPSYRRTDFGTNQDHFQNTLTSCGPRNIVYGDKLQLYKQWRKKGLSKMVNVMSFMPKQREERSKIYGNERLEFLGDAVIEIIARYLLYTHSVDFCHDSTYIYARSDAFEAVMAAVALDGGLDVVDRIFGAVLFGDSAPIHRVWARIPPHPLQAEYPHGDRELVLKIPTLKKLFELEDRLGIKFRHLRLLARALTVRKTGYNVFTLGDNQRLEFLGDSLLKYVTTDYLFRHFPRHHEGHLSLLKNSLVNKYTQAAVCSELGLDQFIIRREENSLTISSIPEETTASATRRQQNVKNKADLLEAFIGALYVDKDITWVERFCQVCFWPRLVEFILKQEWNDPKSKLQQCCLTFRALNEDPEIAHYRLLESAGPSNDREYKVGVFFKGSQLAVGVGRSLQSAEMAAAKNALDRHQEQFKQLHYQRRVIEKKYRLPYREKMLNKLKNWEESLVDKFVGDVPEDGREGVNVSEAASKRRRLGSANYEDDESEMAEDLASWGFVESDMDSPEESRR